MSDEQPLPPVIARMWGREETPRRGPRPSLDTAEVVDAAVAVADEHGLARVTMSSVAARLGVAPMSLYRYVGSKEELLVLMTDAAAPDPPSPGALGWREYVALWTRAQRDHLLRRPWLLDIHRIAAPFGPRELRWMEAMLAALEGTRLDLGARVNIATALSSYASTQANLARQLTTPTRSPETSVSRSAYTTALTQVLNPQDYPILSALARFGGFGDSEEWIEDADFLFGLNLLCAGIDALIETPAQPEPPLCSTELRSSRT